MVVVNSNIKYIKKNGKEKYGFYMDDILVENLRNYFIKGVQNKWDGIGLFTGMEGCLDGNTRIKTNNGPSNINQIKTNTLVVKSLDMRSKQIIDAFAIVKKTGRKECFKLKLKDGSEVNATEDHKFFIKKDGNIFEKRLRDLRQGDKILCVK
ncbi:MAG: Hint domain-containing protein [Kosmotogaceae bacterium]